MEHERLSIGREKQTPVLRLALLAQDDNLVGIPDDKFQEHCRMAAVRREEAEEQ
jgi:hypothetical protein